MQEWRKDPYSLQEMIPYPHFPADNAGTLDQRVEIVLEWNQPFVDSNYGRRLLHQRADELYDRWEGETKNSPDTMGYGSVDLDRNLAYAAMYIFAGKSYAELSNLPGAQLECTVVARAVKSLLQALHLPVRKPGRPRKRAKAEDVG
jgi:hypothetical protein